MGAVGGVAELTKVSPFSGLTPAVSKPQPIP